MCVIRARKEKAKHPSDDGSIELTQNGDLELVVANNFDQDAEENFCELPKRTSTGENVKGEVDENPIEQQMTIKELQARLNFGAVLPGTNPSKKLTAKASVKRYEEGATDCLGNMNHLEQNKPVIKTRKPCQKKNAFFSDSEEDETPVKQKKEPSPPASPC